jgi:hypothetical protein
LKADIGSNQHDILEALILDSPIPSCPEHLEGVEIDGETVDHDAIADGTLNFITDYGLTKDCFEMAEATVANPQYGYAGTLDFVAWFPTIRIPGKPGKGARLCVDAKTGANLDDAHRAQIVSYKNATEVWVDELGNKAEMPEVDLCAILHIRREYKRGYKLFVIPPKDERFYWQWFLNSLTTYKSQADAQQRRMEVFYPPLDDGSQPLPLLEDLEGDGFGRCRKAFIEAGLQDLSDLAALTRREAFALHGVGKAAIEASDRALARYGLAFKGEVA